MARVQLASLGTGIAQNRLGAVIANTPGTIYLHATTDPVDVYAAEIGGSPDTSGTFTTDLLGKIPGWVDAGTVMDITIPPAATITAYAGGPADALGVGDKIRWGSYIELWGDITAAGYQIADEDEFNTDTSAAYTFIGGSGWVSADRWMQFISTSSGAYRSDWGPFDDTTRVEVDFMFENLDDGRAAAWFQHTGTDHRVGFGVAAQGAAGIYDIESYFGGSLDRADIGNVTLAAGVWYRLRATRQGDNLEYQLIRVDTGADVIAPTIYAIPGAALAELGAGVNLGDVGYDAWAGAANHVYIDNLRVYTVQQESRDLYVKITPSGGGVPVTKRIFGIQGPSTQRTDF